MQRQKIYGIFCVRDNNDTIEGIRAYYDDTINSLWRLYLTKNTFTPLSKDQLDIVLSELKFKFPKFIKKSKFIPIRISRTKLPLPIEINRTGWFHYNVPCMNFSKIENIVELRKWKLKRV
jgi:hypothetical protein